MEDIESIAFADAVRSVFGHHTSSEKIEKLRERLVGLSAQSAEGHVSRRFEVYYMDINNERLVDGEYETLRQVFAHKFRPDRRYEIGVDGTFMTAAEFRKWARGQS